MLTVADVPEAHDIRLPEPEKTIGYSYHLWLLELVFFKLDAIESRLGAIENERRYLKDWIAN